LADIDKRRGKWVARWREPNGRQRSKAFDQYRDAQRHLTKVQSALDEGRYVPSEAGKITIREYAEGWLAAQTFAESTRESHERALRLHVYPVIGDDPIGQLAPSRMQAWIKGLSVGSGSAHTICTLLATILNAAVDDEIITRNPFHVRSVRPPAVDRRKLRPWPAERVAAVRDGLAERYRAMVDCGAGLGMRQGEVLALSPDDVEFLGRNRVVHVRRQIKIVGGELVFDLPKGGKERDVPLPDQIGLRLAAHIGQFPVVPVTLLWKAPGGKPVTAALMFTTPRQQPIRRNTFNFTPWRAALKSAGVPAGRDAGFHQLRHHFASTLLASGVDIRALATWLGHEDPGFTLRVYCHLMLDTADKMRAAVDAALSAGAYSGAHHAHGSLAQR
jgi:integrase